MSNESTRFLEHHPHHWYDIRNWKLWAAISATLLVACVTFALVSTTLDRNAARGQLTDIQAENQCRSRAANAVNVALTSKVISLGEVDELVGQFVVQLSTDRSQIPGVVERLGEAITTSKVTGQALQKAVEAQKSAIEACKEPS